MTGRGDVSEGLWLAAAAASRGTPRVRPASARARRRTVDGVQRLVQVRRHFLARGHGLCARLGPQHPRVHRQLERVQERAEEGARRVHGDRRAPDDGLGRHGAHGRRRGAGAAGLRRQVLVGWVAAECGVSGRARADGCRGAHAGGQRHSVRARSPAPRHAPGCCRRGCRSASARWSPRSRRSRHACRSRPRARRTARRRARTTARSTLARSGGPRCSAAWRACRRRRPCEVSGGRRWRYEVRARAARKKAGRAAGGRMRRAGATHRRYAVSARRLVGCRSPRDMLDTLCLRAEEETGGRRSVSDRRDARATARTAPQHAGADRVGHADRAAARS